MKPLIICFFVSLNLSGQTFISDIRDTVKVEEIREINVYSTRKTTDSGLLALPMETVTKSTLVLPSFFTPADALQQKAGISLIRDGVWATSVNIRGLSKERIMILSDGERIQTATDVAAALSTIDMNSLERIEVIKGAGSVLYGTGAMGGVVNFITERPHYTPSLQVNGKIGGGFNSVNNLWATNAKVQVTDHNWSLAANGSYRAAQNIKTPDGILGNSQFNDASFGLQGGMTYDDSQELLVNYQHYRGWDIGLPGGPFHEEAKSRYRSVSRNLLSGEYVFYEPASTLMELRIKAYTQNISREVESYREDQKLNILPSSENRTSGAKILTDWDLLSAYHALQVGIEGWYRDAETKRYKIKETGEYKYNVTGEQPVPNAQMLDLGIFAQYSWKIRPGKLTFDAGIRLDYIRTKNDTAFDKTFTSVIEDGIETIDEGIVKDILFAPGLANELSYAAHVDLIYKPARKHKITLSLSNAYRAASLEERFKYIDLANSNVIQKGDPNLKPEKGLFSNLNYTCSGEKFQLSTDVFANYLFDLITEKRTGSNSGTDTLKNVNIDNALFLGAEVEVSYWFTHSFRATANASYTYARDVKNSEFLPQIPPLKGMAELNYRHRHLFTVSASANWAAKQSQVAKGEDVTDGHIILNAAIQSAKLEVKPVYLQLFAGVDNILNTAYYNHLSTTRGINRLEPGRNIYAKIQLGW